MKRHSFPLFAILLSVCLLALASFASGVSAQRSPTGSSTLVGGIGPRATVCTSTDGKSSCTCAAKCQATAGACQCYGIPPAPSVQDDAPQGAADLLAPGGRRGATCVSGDGKKTCACGERSCDATPIGCACFTK
ncbi:MAG: hypothetical protein ACOY82_00085 [Pseudomonadota bacterium]